MIAAEESRNPYIKDRKETHRYGQMTFTIIHRYSDFYAQNCSLELEDRSIDICNLPQDHPARTRDDLNLRVLIDRVGLYGTEYDHKEHKIYFNDLDFHRLHFPWAYFEELNHAATSATIKSLLQGIDKDKPFPDSLPEQFKWLPPPVQELIHGQTAHSKVLPENDTQYFTTTAFKAAHEFIARSLTLQELYKWCKEDWSKIGFNPNYLAEYVLLTLVTHTDTNREDLFNLFSAGLLRYPPRHSRKKVSEMVIDRINILDGLPFYTDMTNFRFFDPAKVIDFYSIFMANNGLNLT